MPNLTTKEKMLLQDQKKHEQICIQKYQNYAQQVQEPQAQQLFNSLAQKEQQHLNSINQLLSGQVPSVSSGQQGQQSMQQQSQQNMQQQGQATGQNSLQGAMAGQQTQALFNDMLMTEKYVSGSYDTAIFEFTDPNARKVLNHIQTEEQQHGEALFQYMQSQGMYNPQ